MGLIMSWLVPTVSAQGGSLDYMGYMLRSVGLSSDDTQVSTVGGFISRFLPYVYGIATAMLLLSFVVVGLRIALQGKKGLETSRKTIIWSVIGYAIVMLAALITQVVINFFNADIGVFGS